MKYVLTFAFLTVTLLFGASTFSGADETGADQSTAQSHAFTKKRYSIRGGWTVDTIDGKTVIRFDEDFKTKGGPDLKVYLSKSPIGQITSKTAADNAVKLSVLRSNRGAQNYTIPDDINLSDYKSVIIHCEAYSVLWGGFDIAEAMPRP